MGSPKRPGTSGHKQASHSPSCPQYPLYAMPMPAPLRNQASGGESPAQRQPWLPLHSPLPLRYSPSHRVVQGPRPRLFAPEPPPDRQGRAGQQAGKAPAEEWGQAKWMSGQDQRPAMESGQWGGSRGKCYKSPSLADGGRTECTGRARPQGPHLTLTSGHSARPQESSPAASTRQ